MIDHVSLLINSLDLLSKEVWQAVFSDNNCVSVIDSWEPNVDAALVSVYRCDEYGCPAGSTDDTLGVMYIFDTWLFEPPSAIYPRVLISNAVWREEPTLEVAAENRLKILRSTIETYNSLSSVTISSVIIDCAVLGMWGKYSYEYQVMVIEKMNSLIHNLICY